jgi:hypothetical protein
MKKLMLAFALTIATAQSFAAASFLAGLNDKYLALGGLLTTTTTSVHWGFMAGLVVFADNGEAYINVGSDTAKEALKLAVQKINDGEELTLEDKAIIEIYAQATGLTEADLIAKVTPEL